MSKVCFGMTLSLDGFVNDRNSEVNKRFASFEPNEKLASMLQNTRAVVMERNIFEAGGDTDTYAETLETK